MEQDNQVTETTSNESVVESSEPSIAEAVSEAVDTHFEADDAPAERQANPARQDNREAATQAKAIDENAPLDWDKLPPKAKQEYLKAQEQYKNLQSIFSKKQNEWKQTSTKASEYEKKVKLLEHWEKIYESDPELKQFINKKLGVQSDIDPEIQHDPVYNYVSKYQQETNAKLNMLMQRYEREEMQMREKSLDDRVNKETSVAEQRFEEFLGRKPTDSEVVKLYQYMRENKIYNGDAAVKGAFFDDFKSAIVQKALDEQMKKRAVGTRISSVRTSKAPDQSQDMGSIRDYVSSALEGMEF